MTTNQIPPAIATGRMDTGLNVLEIQIVHGRGTLTFDPNGMIVAAVSESLDLGEAIGPSSLSGEPGYLFRTHEVQILLTKGEVYRLVRRCLDPSEYRKLRALAGDFFEVHSDFYDEATGEALQPV